MKVPANKAVKRDAPKAAQAGEFKLQGCRRRSKSDPPRRSNIDPGMDADRVTAGCG